MRILLVEDNIDLNEALKEILVRNGYSVDTAFDGDEALDYIEVVEYDAIILDIMLPRKDGFQILKILRDKSITYPVLCLTAKDSIEDRVRGLDLGAEDYLVKPFSTEELLARLRVITRKKGENLGNTYEVANLTVDIASRIVRREGKTIDLSTKEFSILEYLIQNKNIVLSREQILEHAWDFDYFGGSNIVDVYINYLRKKIDKDYEPKLIHTIRNAGYVLREE